MKKENKIWVAIVVALVFSLTTSPVIVTKNELRQALADQVVNTRFSETSEIPLYYTAQKGDCLWSLASRFGVSLNLLAYANNLGNDSVLLENTKLTIPVDKIITYTVTEGDSLWSISQKFNTTVETLFYDNSIDASDILLTDQSLKVRAEEITFEKEPVQYKGTAIPKLKVWPVFGTVSSGFGPRNGRMHKGLDIVAEYGLPIRAVDDGKVVFADKRGTYGNTVIINHGGGFRSLYGHASRLEVSPGQFVKRGQIVARIGSSGRSTGAHLHIELLYKGVPYNPEYYLPDKLKL